MSVLANLNIKIGADVKEFNRAMSNVDRNIRNVTRNLDKVGREMTRTFTLPIAGAAAFSIKMAGDFEASMNRVRAISGATSDEFDEMRKVAKKMGAETQYSASQAADSLTMLAQAGFSAREASQALPGVLQLAASGAVDLSEAANIASNILRGYNLEVKDLSRINDVLTKTFVSTNTNLTQLGESFQYVGPIAAGLGLSIEETAAAIGLLGNAGFAGSTAGTALRGALSRLVNPTKQADTILKSLGIAVKDTTGRMLPFNQIIEQLEKSGATTADMMALFGDRAGPGMAALVSQGSAALRELTEKNLKSAGTAAEIAASTMEGFNGQMKELRSAAEALGIAIGEAGLLNKVTNLTKSLTTTLQTLSETNPALLNTATNIGLITAAIGPAMLGLAQLIKAGGTIAKTFKMAGAAIGTTAGAVGGIAAVLGYGAVKGTKGTQEDIRSGAGHYETSIKYGSLGMGADLFARATQGEYFVNKVGPGVVAALEDINGAFSDMSQEAEKLPPFAQWFEDAQKSAETLTYDFEEFFDPKEAEKAAKAAAKAAEKAAKEEEKKQREAHKKKIAEQFKYLLPGEMRIQDVTTARDRVSLKGLEAPKMISDTSGMENLTRISDKLRESITFTTSAWIEMSDAAFGAHLFMDAFGDSLQHVAESMSAVAAAGGGFMDTVGELKRAAREAIGAHIRRGIASIVSGTLEKSSFLGPLAIPLGVAAGALAQGAFNSILRKINVPAFAEGGIVSGPTLGLIGEYAGAGQNPEVIAPLDRLKSMLGGAQKVQVEVVGRISGRDIELTQERTRILSNRLRGA